MGSCGAVGSFVRSATAWSECYMTEHPRESRTQPQRSGTQHVNLQKLAHVGRHSASKHIFCILCALRLCELALPAASPSGCASRLAAAYT